MYVKSENELEMEIGEEEEEAEKNRMNNKNLLLLSLLPPRKASEIKKKVYA